jgi:hypothetical protein
MRHLETERLAALDTDEPTPDELAHLATCASCRREREAFARLADLAAGEAELLATRTADGDRPHLTDWGTLSAALRREGLLTRPSGEVERASVEAAEPVEIAALPVRDVRTWPMVVSSRPWYARAAAAAALLLVGAVGGRMSAGAGADPSAAAVVAALPAANASGGVAEFGSVAEATSVLDRAQRDYERASLWLASHDTTVNAQTVYRARLAALEQMLTASRAGLFEAPQDPVLNQYYLAAYTAREATLRQLGESLPVDRVMESF